MNYFLGFLKRLGLILKRLGLILLFIPWFFAIPLVMLTGILQWVATGKNLLDNSWVEAYMGFFL